MVWIKGISDTGAYRKVVPHDRIWFANDTRNAVRKQVRFAAVLRADLQEYEFVSSYPGCDISLAKDSPEPIRNGL